MNRGRQRTYDGILASQVSLQAQPILVRSRQTSLDLLLQQQALKDRQRLQHLAQVDQSFQQPLLMQNVLYLTLGRAQVRSIHPVVLVLR
ncbi:hypothetical protein VIOR3934_12460 [Vibrio orientalis CIP 102891 = ATCC 33934]|uniref:Uncharacterized protein n=1 Tax=Vibrio orientalis CIP 102891 = ATCC 33934 TaxID=675816 RepID=F9STQ1_VIBOR|nr:hypothetical protein VIOR3934_12460 [Vibrio orientalis CIP 102891 = ATCC 33934]